ncbi:MAG: amidohydrolase family protein [Bacteroidota bacterium]
MRTLLKTAVLTLIACFIVWGSALAQTTYIHAGHLIDGISDDVKSSVTLIIEGDKIADIKNRYVKVPGDARYVDLKDSYVMPGFIDLHVHMENETSPDNYIKRFTLDDADVAFNASKYAKTTLMAGFTTVRDVGGRGVNINLRDAINAGDIPGPRIYTSGKSIATTGGHADPTNGWRDLIQGHPGPKEGVINGTAEAREAVRQRYKNGADLIKITATGGVLSLAKSGDAPQFFMDELETIVQTATDYGMHVATHAHGAEGMKRAVQAGVKTIEHGTYMTPEIMELMKANDTYYIPTITAGKAVADSAEIPGYYPEVVVPKAKAIGPLIQNTFAKAYQAGVPIAFGTDAGVYAHGRNGKEFGYMVEAGMPAMEAIQTATSIAAKVLNADGTIGQLKEGFQADMVAVQGNPLDSIALLENIDFVMKDGKVYTE